jgi:hypothetical protein
VTDVQLSALGRVCELLERARLDHWLFGGWAVDFYVGEVTRGHFDVDLAVWHSDLAQIVELLERDGWRHAPLADEDGGTGYEREGVRLELTYLVRLDDGRIAIPLRSGPVAFRDGTFGGDVGELQGVRARLIGLEALTAGKGTPREDPEDAAKDRADFQRLSIRGQ